MNPLVNDGNDESNMDHASSPKNNNKNLNGSAKNCSNDCDINTKNEVKVHENLYRMIVSQLLYDGHQQIAVALSAIIQVFS